MDSHEIKATLRRSGKSVAALARDLGVHESAVRAAIEGRGRAARIEAAIAEQLGLPAASIWPQWYGGSVAPAATPERLPSLDLDLLCSIQQAYWNAAAARGDDPILPLDAKHLGRIYNRCAEQLPRSVDIAAKNAAAVREIAYLAQMDNLPRFEPPRRQAGATFNVNTYGDGAVTTNHVEGGKVKIDMRRKTPRE